MSSAQTDPTLSKIESGFNAALDGILQGTKATPIGQLTAIFFLSEMLFGFIISNKFFLLLFQVHVLLEASL